MSGLPFARIDMNPRWRPSGAHVGWRSPARAVVIRRRWEPSAFINQTSIFPDRPLVNAIRTRAEAALGAIQDPIARIAARATRAVRRSVMPRRAYPRHRSSYVIGCDSRHRSFEPGDVPVTAELASLFGEPSDLREPDPVVEGEPNPGSEA